MATSVCCMSAGSKATRPFGQDQFPGIPGAVVPFEDGLDGTLGVRFLEVTPERVVTELDVADRVRQPFGLVHGGVYAVIAESAASFGAGVGVAPSGQTAVGLSNNTAFVRPFIGEGTLHSVASRIHAGRTTQLWDVEHRDDQQRLCATSRVTIAVRAPREP